MIYETIFERPVKGEVLLSSPEMSLSMPGEIVLDQSCVDEGVGTGFDGENPMAYAERIITVQDSEAFFNWYQEQLEKLGWSLQAPDGGSDDKVKYLQRLSAERIQLQILPMNESLAAHYDRTETIGRVAFSVVGFWPDGTL